MPFLNNCVERIFNAGGSPDVIMCDSALKVKMSSLAGSSLADIVTNHDKASPASAVNSVDVIVTDFGTFKIVPNRFCLANQLYVLDYDFWSIDYLRPFQTETLAKTGDSVKQMMIAEYGLRGKNGQASGAVIGVKAA
jgi:citrate lyase alpha subunit